MATPHGDTRGKLNAGLTNITTSEALNDVHVQEDEFQSHTFGFDHDLYRTPDTLHSCLEPSILSMLEDSAAGEVKSRIDEESEATLLSALSDMLDSVIEDSLSPFDTLPDSDLFMNQVIPESRIRRSHPLSVSNSIKEAAPRVLKSPCSSFSNHKTGALHSDRQLRPRLHRRTKLSIVQRSDCEEEDLGETKRRPVRIFRIESDPSLAQDEQQDGFVPMLLADLIRHMHPYSLRVAFDKESHRQVDKLQEEEEEEDMFVDVEGDDDDAAAICGVTPVLQHEVSLLGWKSENGHTENKIIVSPPKDLGSSCRVKKKVTFAPVLTLVHEYQPEYKEHDDMADTPSSEDLKVVDSKTPPLDEADGAKTSLQGGRVKPKSLSLQEYRLLRQKTIPKDERKPDHRTKWPLVPEAPTELPPINLTPGCTQSQGNQQSSSADINVSVKKSSKNLGLVLKSPQKRTKPVQTVDPPNPVLLTFKTSIPSNIRISQPSDNLEDDHDVAQRSLNIHKQPDSISHEHKQQASVSSKDSPVKLIKCSDITESPSLSVPNSPSTNMASQTAVPPMHIQMTNADQHHEEKQRKASSAEMGIEANDVTSLLEQFETQGLTPPATPPHQIWRPSLPAPKAKSTPTKAIQIIEPQPLPPSKFQSKPQSCSVPAPSITIALMDHDYGRPQDINLSNNKALSVHMHINLVKEPKSNGSHKPLDNRTCGEPEPENCSSLLSPESSPSRLEASNVGEIEELERKRTLRRCSRSPSPLARGRPDRRCYRRRYPRSDSTSTSCSSSSSSSESSCSPPRKRRRSRYPDSSSSSSSRSSSRSLSPSPIRERRRRYCRPQSRSFSHSRSRSQSPHDWNHRLSRWNRQRDHHYEGRWEEVQPVRKQKAIEERRVVYVGRIRGSMTKDELGERFALFGNIEDVTVHFRSHGDNFGFVTYYNTDDAFAAIENGKKLRLPDELPFDICFGGRRQFCQSNYMDLDSSRETDPDSVRSKGGVLDFDTLLKQAQRGRKT